MIGKNSPCWCGSGKKYKHCHEEWDNTINVLKLQGKIVPSHNLIKSEEDIKWIKKAAKINTKTRAANRPAALWRLLLSTAVIWESINNRLPSIYFGQFQ